MDKAQILIKEHYFYCIKPKLRQVHHRLAGEQVKGKEHSFMLSILARSLVRKTCLNPKVNSGCNLISIILNQSKEFGYKSFTYSLKERCCKIYLNTEKAIEGKTSNVSRYELQIRFMKHSITCKESRVKRIMLNEKMLVEIQFNIKGLEEQRMTVEEGLIYKAEEELLKAKSTEKVIFKVIKFELAAKEYLRILVWFANEVLELYMEIRYKYSLKREDSKVIAILVKKPVKEKYLKEIKNCVKWAEKATNLGGKDELSST